MPELTAQHRRRGVVPASVTRLRTCLDELERFADQPNRLDSAKQMLSKLESLDSEFRKQHFATVDLVEGEEALAAEQAVLDSHDDDVAQLSLRLQRVISSCSTSTKVNPHRTLQKRLTYLQTALTSISTSLASLPDGSDGVILLRQFEEQLSDHKGELSEIRNLLFALDLEETDELNELLKAVEKSCLNAHSM